MLITTIIVGIVVYIILKFIYYHFFPRDYKRLADYKEGWFGKLPKPDETNEEDKSINKFEIKIPAEVIQDLKQRLERTRFEDPVESSLFHYGFNPIYLQEVVGYWHKEYDWYKQEELINSFSHFKTRLEGLNVHFLHAKPKLPADSKLKVIPLMIIHGWPGSFVEFLKALPLLTTPRSDVPFVFEVICPSIPGFGFSESPHKKGFNIRACARIFVQLMERLDFPHFYVQGGDWGSAISSLMARYYPHRILGVHNNMFFFPPRSWDRLKYLLTALFPSLVTPEEYKTVFPITTFFKKMLSESGYFHMQATKPDTLGCAMSDSPAGMAAYLLEKFGAGTDSQNLNRQDGGLTKKFTMDELLTNVMMYWLNNNFTAAARFYKENVKDMIGGKHEKVPVTVPCGISLFPHELLVFPRNMISQQVHDLVSYNVMPRGGHFAALEEPELFAEEVWRFVRKVESRKCNS